MNIKKPKVYKIIKVTRNDGRDYFKLHAANSRLGMFIGASWEYTAENYTLEEAIEQINIVHNDAILKEVKVYFTTKKEIVKHLDD